MGELHCRCTVAVGSVFSKQQPFLSIDLNETFSTHFPYSSLLPPKNSALYLLSFRRYGFFKVKNRENSVN